MQNTDKCQTCNYFREQSWCSNSKSPKFRYARKFDRFVNPDDSCDEHYRTGKKASFITRKKAKLIGWINKKRKK